MRHPHPSQVLVKKPSPHRTVVVATNEDEDVVVDDEGPAPTPAQMRRPTLELQRAPGQTVGGARVDHQQDGLNDSGDEGDDEDDNDEEDVEEEDDEDDDEDDEDDEVDSTRRHGRRAPSRKGRLTMAIAARRQSLPRLIPLTDDPVSEACAAGSVQDPVQALLQPPTRCRRRHDPTTYVMRHAALPRTTTMTTMRATTMASTLWMPTPTCC